MTFRPAYRINNAGTIVGMSYTRCDSPYHACSYSRSGMTDLASYFASIEPNGVPDALKPWPASRALGQQGDGAGENIKKNAPNRSAAAN